MLLRRFAALTLVLIAEVALSTCFTGGAHAAPPNILVFVADDMDWQDLGCMGNEAITTPNIDGLADRGMKATSAFLTTPQCSPSRISILTGKYPHATGAEDLHMPLLEDETFATSALREHARYFAGHMRKTHYGPHGNEQFDWYSGKFEDFPDFLDESGGKPFFMWVGFRDSHRPYSEGAFEPPHDPAEVNVPPYLADTPETRKDLALYYDEVARMDKNIGTFLDTLEERGLTENTLIIFIADNGMPFPRAKGTLYDSGIRTPFVVAWPGVIEEGTTYDGLVSVIDLAPTFLDAAGLESRQHKNEMQGRSMLPAFRDPETEGREYIYAERNWHDCDEHMRAVRTDRYKLIRNAYLELPHGTPLDLGRSPSFKSLLRLKEAGELTPAQGQLFRQPRPRLELYDIQEDPWETTNLAESAEHKRIAERLETVLDAWRYDTDDFPSTLRRRADHTKRLEGERFREGIPPMTHTRPPQRVIRKFAHRIAVMGFESEEVLEDTLDALRLNVESAIAKRQRFDVLERQELEAVLSEQQLSDALRSAQAALRLGEVIPADTLIVADLKANNDKAIMFVRAVSGEDSRQLFSTNVYVENISDSGSIQNAARVVAQRIYDAFPPVLGEIQEVSGNRIRINRGENDGLHLGQRLVAYYIEDPWIDEETGEVLQEGEISSIAHLKISSLEADYCTARAAGDSASDYQSLKPGMSVATR